MKKERSYRMVPRRESNPPQILADLACGSSGKPMKKQGILSHHILKLKSWEILGFFWKNVIRRALKRSSLLNMDHVGLALAIQNFLALTGYSP